ncbi:hypothetical protein A3C21_01545 [Candidatus Kaiserbacteria bacterium RIFCSPHIGHO2_02_FULL_59_21]|uniref:Uncharacterized protein n=1 Tax=Candidatus Kaiserbacteria bacterium RIFCSPHIGHO2_02_FULL_59_21 TaxID=1798500 RepID=A0A1F6E1L7_9BACT|nr:MAG: hypothetical protein A2766_00625 [Candidatus Kaiserbacteria bacterium RIFCSPHIGHO2_01_FULL_58_22]OGG67553.1 MAG: hypothetical protein A3C21_01545 [Candidatus Kaiserbacteria bacterium RIFCSPHIGHO2_02_FULL_59_21]OGG80157.1 MAG: hypothetical protein A2952_03675 [Candidatus Kaiserbacteria bacterium RIFCSPLOWO2_01_FULL_59_34]OGG86948.1 MAG: hypothetical protein A3I47_03065 [Candidatus Kaiserbacteria bacterium RIFCSPLOWO2_02_FULL_59_19]
MKKLAFFSAPLVALAPKTALAHCPLCTVGAGALALFAAYLGVSTVVVGVLVGAFALALALWLAPMVKKEYVPYQKPLIATLVFLSTVLPVMPLIREYGPLYVSLGGEYGTIFHNTYTVNLFVLGAALGAALVALAPVFSRALTRVRGGQMPYQGMALTLGLLIAASVIIQVWP